jgi:hypothetical protein
MSDTYRALCLLLCPAIGVLVRLLLAFRGRGRHAGGVYAKMRCKSELSRWFVRYSATILILRRWRWMACVVIEDEVVELAQCRKDWAAGVLA